MNLIQTPAMAALGCGGSLILLGSFATGFYWGNSQAMGRPIDSTLENVMRYGPAVLGGLFSVMASTKTMSVPENLEEAVKNAPPGVDTEQAKGCLKGCGPVMSGFIGAAIMSGATYIGYFLGYTLGK